MKELKIISPATSANLGAGFDCLGLALNFYNETIIKKNSFFRVSIKGEGDDNIYLKKHNLFIIIFNETYYKLTGKKDNFSFSFVNNIPLSRGLGSSSSIIVAAIASAYYFAGLSINKNMILNQALDYENHPDNISPAVLGGFVCSLVENLKVNYIRTTISDSIKAVVCIPNKAISTNASRKALPTKLSLEDSCFNIAHSSLTTAAFMSKNYDMLKVAAKDRLHERGRMMAIPELFKVQELAIKNGALMSNLSGSGSTFFNLCYNDDANKLNKILSDNFKDMRVLTLDFNNTGFEIL
ncbi:homoserine kinase [Campylobacter sp. MG1]|uniref:homoserine kinase n=1 Tax=Campylobacter sp. MG1 TaxID=2976332 RepID=UPI00226C6892|nr:homoserine kinase [Campylobacter sp. MG1]